MIRLIKAEEDGPQYDSIPVHHRDNTPGLKKFTLACLCGQICYEGEKKEKGKGK
ncbi:UNVERIFIED_CONTAM: hypothetical protein FKN15_042152 [Acipenser sinensis]